MIHLAVRLCTHQATLLEVGTSFLIALAKLRTFELKESTDIEQYLLVRSAGHYDESLYLIGEIDMYEEDVQKVRSSMGRWGSDLSIFAARPEPLVAMKGLTDEEVLLDMLAEAGGQMPCDWKDRLIALEKKHCPPPAIVNKVRNSMASQYSAYIASHLR